MNHTHFPETEYTSLWSYSLMLNTWQRSSKYSIWRDIHITLSF